MWGSGDRRTKREPIPYICDFSRGLGAKVGCERFHANIQPAATKATNMVYLSFSGLSLEGRGVNYNIEVICV